MKGNMNISKHNMTDYEMENIISTCRQFDNLQFTIPVLSVYEGQETKNQESRFRPNRLKNKPIKLVSCL